MLLFTQRERDRTYTHPFTQATHLDRVVDSKEVGCQAADVLLIGKPEVGDRCCRIFCIIDKFIIYLFINNQKK